MPSSLTSSSISCAASAAAAAGALELVTELLELAAAGHQPGEFVQGDLLFRVVADALAAV
jgi:hypothetical protein